MCTRIQSDCSIHHLHEMLVFMQSALLVRDDVAVLDDQTKIIMDIEDLVRGASEKAMEVEQALLSPAGCSTVTKSRLGKD